MNLELKRFELGVDGAMRNLLLGLTVFITGCRFLSAPSPSVSPDRPQLLSAGNPADPSRQPNALPARRCVVACAAGFHCDERSAECVPDGSPAQRDGGLSWLP